MASLQWERHGAHVVISPAPSPPTAFFAGSRLPIMFSFEDVYVQIVADQR